MLRFGRKYWQFQSLLCWNTSIEGFREMALWPGIRVSILVVLEYLY